MKITIDTSVDSKEDIRKAAALLASLADGRHEHHSNIFENDSSPGLGASETSSSDSAAGNAFASMFGDGSEQTEEKNEEKEDIPEIIEY